MAIAAYSLNQHGTVYLSKNFRVREFRCQDGTDPIFVDMDLVDILQKVRDHFKKAVTITSAFRTASHNKSVNGATYSQHLYGRAADIKVSGVSPKDVAAYLETLLPNTGGIGVYSSWVHVDTRPIKSRWTG